MLTWMFVLAVIYGCIKADQSPTAWHRPWPVVPPQPTASRIIVRAKPAPKAVMVAQAPKVVIETDASHADAIKALRGLGYSAARAQNELDIKSSLAVAILAQLRKG